ncbi:hypothetical protein F0L68_31430 [Solihabitans fulvus]|uniref:Uncharacterized protein n=1 Tax=Solihabitans fulvus TaxID=1892852 RepID=A0A5B2WT32_9PSEU|nr:hypothetical protein [Solihabitans fulvus]KAA2254118.1 hypothetical protein F0L68_31430 [Solihabitans fulvus]
MAVTERVGVVEDRVRGAGPGSWPAAPDVVMGQEGTLPAPRLGAEESDGDATTVLRAVVERTLVAVRPADLAGARRAEEPLRDALRAVDSDGSDGQLVQGLACVEAACEHLRFGELTEARTLLVAARGQLGRAQPVPATRPVVPGVDPVSTG